MVEVVKPPRAPVSTPQGLPDQGRIVDKLHKLDRELLDLEKQRKGGLGSRPPRVPGTGGLNQFRKGPSPQTGFKWGRIGVAGGLLISVANPFGGFENYLRPFVAPLFPQGEFGRDVGLICFVSACSPVSGVVGVKASNNCVPLTPQCPFGTVFPPINMGNSYKQAGDAQFGFEGWEQFFPYANLVYIKTTFTPGYFVHEVQLVSPGLDVGMRPGPLLIPVANLAEGYRVVNPNALPKQRPDEEGDHAEPRTRTQTENRAQRSAVTKKFVTVFTGRRGPPTRRPERRVPRPGPKNERKLQFSSLGAYRVVMGAIDTITESQDFIRAIYKALPCSVRAGQWKSGPKGGRYFQRAKGKKGKYDSVGQLDQIARNFDKIDWSTAMLNVVENQVEDAVIGMQNRMLGDALGARQSWSNYARFKGIQKEFREVSRKAALSKGGRGKC